MHIHPNSRYQRMDKVWNEKYFYDLWKNIISSHLSWLPRFVQWCRKSNLQSSSARDSTLGHRSTLEDFWRIAENVGDLLTALFSALIGNVLMCWSQAMWLKWGSGRGDVRVSLRWIFSSSSCLVSFPLFLSWMTILIILEIVCAVVQFTNFGRMLS